MALYKRQRISRWYPEPRPRVRTINAAQAAILLSELPDHLREMAGFVLNTGLRQANVTGLRWEQVVMERSTICIRADPERGGKDIIVRLNDEAMEILKRQIGKHPDRVFTYKAMPVKRVNTRSWRSAVTRAGILDFRWSDLRHTWARWQIENGATAFQLMEMAGWNSLDMVHRYACFFLFPCAAKLNSLLREARRYR